MHSANDQRQILQDLVERGLDQLADGITPDLDALCREHPQLRATVAETLDLGIDLTPLHKLAVEVDPRIGSAIGERYAIEARLGTGAMGVVYRATDRELKRAVAVKLLHAPDFGSTTNVERFVREVEALAALRHPHILTIHDCGRDDRGTPYLVTDLLEGAPLSDLLQHASDLAIVAGTNAAVFTSSGWRARALDSDQVLATEEGHLRFAVRLTLQIAEALECAHQAQIRHRDVKPSNIFVTKTGDAVLLDFGLAKRSDDAQLTAADSVVGTPCYMAPEQAGGDATRPATASGAATDVYGLAATLYHLLTLRPPFEGDLPGILLRIQRDDPTPAIKLHPGLPADLVAILDKGLEREPERRYQSMTALVADLRAFLEHRPVSARPLTRLGRLWRSARRQPARSTAIVTAALALIASTVAMPLWLEHRARQDSTELANLRRALPARLAIEGDPDRRALMPTDERDGNLAHLDRILELDPKDVATRLMRSALLVDSGRAGDLQRAANDLDILAAQVDSPYTRAVAARYKRATATEHGAADIDLSELGVEPASPSEFLIAGFHELRNRHVAGFATRAKALLDRASDALIPARDLRLLALLGLIDEVPRDERRGVAQQAMNEALWLEGQYDGPTARTRSVVGLAMIAMRRYAEAIAPLEASLAIRPDRHGPLHNLGVAHFHLGEDDAALRRFEQALALRPWFWNTRYHLSLLLARRGELERARVTAAALEISRMGARGWLKGLAQGNIELEAALAAYNASDDDALIAAAARAAAFFRSAQDASDDKAVKQRLAINRGLAEKLPKKDGSALPYQIALLRLEPTSPSLIQNVIHLMRTDRELPGSTVKILRAWLERLRDALGTRPPPSANR